MSRGSDLEKWRADVRVKLSRMPASFVKAFAARCARRVMVLYVGSAADTAAVYQAVEVAWLLAADRGAPIGAYSAQLAAKAAADRATAVPAAAHAARVAVQASSPSVRDADLATPTAYTAEVVAASDAAVYAVKAAVDHEPEMIRAIEHDLECFLKQNSTKGKLVISRTDPGSLGPLWSSDEPAGWPNDPWGDVRHTASSLERNREAFEDTHSHPLTRAAPTILGDLVQSRAERTELRTGQVFVSHVSEDQDIAIDLASRLEASGYSTWYYERDGLPGISYLTQVCNAIERCEFFVVLISTGALSSHQMDVEIERAHETGRPIIPIRRGLAHDEFQRRRPLWRQAIGTTTSVEVSVGDVQKTVDRVIAGLRRIAEGSAARRSAA